MKLFPIKIKFINTQAGLLLVLFISAVLLSSCYVTEIRLAPAQAEQAAPPVPAKNVSYASLGLGILDKTKEVKSECGDRNTSSAVIEMNVLDTIIHTAIGFAYTTRHVKVYCVTPPASSSVNSN